MNEREIQLQLNRIEQLLRQLLAAVGRLTKQDLLIGEFLMASIDDIVAQVTAQSTVEDSLISLLNSIAAQLKDAGTDPAKLQAVSDGLKANTDKLAAAIQANTPAAP